MNEWVLEQVKPEISLEANVAKLKLSYLQAHRETAGLFGKDSNAGKREGSRERGRPARKGTDSIKEATSMSLQGLSRAVEDRTLWTPFIHRVARSQN